MGRPKKEEPNHGKYFEVKAVITDQFGAKERRSFYSTISKADAKRQAEEYQRQKLVNELSDDKQPERTVTFKQWSKTWLETYKKGKVKDNTYRNTYCNVVDKYLDPYFGKMAVSLIKPIDIQKFFDLCETKYSIETIKKMRYCLRAIFDTAIENDYLVKSPMTKRLSIASKKVSVKKRAYTQGQYDKLVKYCKENNGLDVLVLLKTAITRSELLGIKWSNLDFENKILYIEQGAANVKSVADDTWRTEANGLKNEYRRRPIPIIDEDVWNMLKAKPHIVYVGSRKNRKNRVPVITQFVFYNRFGRIYNPDNWYLHTYQPFMHGFRDYCLKKYKEDIPILNPHELRHTCATLWKDHGLDIFSIAKLGGWVDLEMLAKRYAHNNVETLRKELQKW